METNYRITETTISMVNYHLVFCSRRRKKIFEISGVENRFKEIVHQICDENQFNLFAITCNEAVCHMYVNVPPTYSPHEIIKMVKTATATELRTEFSQLSKENLWTRCYLASTEKDLPQNIIDDFVNSQKTRT